MKKQLTLLLPLVFIFFSIADAQVKIGDNPASISPGSILELESTTKALTLPRMTTVQMESIPSPVNGMIVFNTDSNCLYLYKTNNAWAGINMQPTAPSVSWPYNSFPLSSGTGVVGNANGIIALTGNGLVASGEYSHAEGLNSIASGMYSWSIGNADTSIGSASLAIGSDNKTTGSYSIAAGYKNVAANQSAVSFGQENSDSGWASVAMGLRNSISNQISYSTAMGYNNQIKGGWSNSIFGESNIIKNGRANSTLGIANIADGNYNNLLGNNNETLAGNSNLLSGEKNKISSGNSNMGFGYNNDANGNFNQLTGNTNSIIAGNSNFLSGENNSNSSGNSNVLLGSANTASANYSAAIGNSNIVYFQSAVALGQGNKDSGWASIAGGLGNVIEKNVQYSISLGINNIATRNDALLTGIPGAATFSAGMNNINSGYGSVAMGAYNRSTNLSSLAANDRTISNGYAMSAFGHYNDTIAAYPGENYAANEILFSIGNGISNTNRRNSLTMLRNGYTSINALSNPGPAIPRAELDVKGTGAIIVPVGTTAERPPAPVEGMIRFCTDCGAGGTSVLQGYNGTGWVNL